MEHRELPQQVRTLASELARSYQAFPGVRAVALGGSQASGYSEHDSDLDVYVYVERPLPVETRRSVPSAASGQAEFGNEFWEPGDEWVDEATGLHLDVMFRDVSWIEGELDRVLERHQASVGYTTAIWHNVRTSISLSDPSGWFADVQTRASGPYPEELRRAIVEKNYPILRTTMSSYRQQIARALAREDTVSVNHRVAALLASYFDILFALNRRTHPGEKRLLAYARDYCSLLPDDFDSQIRQLLEGMFVESHGTLAAIDGLVDGLDELLVSEGLLATLEDRL